jgi:hypothetical protein
MVDCISPEYKITELKSNEVQRIFIPHQKVYSNAPWRKGFMKAKLKQSITRRLNQVVLLLNNPKYDPVRDGFFIPFFRAFFLNKTVYK